MDGPKADTLMAGRGGKRNSLPQLTLPHRYQDACGAVPPQRRGILPVRESLGEDGR